MEKFPGNHRLQQVAEELKDESDEVVCATKYGEVFLAAAESEVDNFLFDAGLCIDEAYLPVVEQS